MFHLREDKIYTAGGECLGDVAGVPELIKVLKELHEDFYLDSNRFTAEGIDREFRAPENFTTNRALWEQDAVNDWRDLPGRVLFERYPVHAECYVSGIIDLGMEPTYEGFRLWLTGINAQRKAIEGWDNE